MSPPPPPALCPPLAAPGRGSVSSAAKFLKITQKAKWLSKVVRGLSYPLPLSVAVSLVP